MSTEDAFNEAVLTMRLAWQAHSTVADDESHGWKCSCGGFRGDIGAVSDHQWSEVGRALLSPSVTGGPSLCVLRAELEQAETNTRSDTMETK